jgi:hypothetical protein
VPAVQEKGAASGELVPSWIELAAVKPEFVSVKVSEAVVWAATLPKEDVPDSARTAGVAPETVILSGATTAPSM